ncbi:MAG: glycosyltransferase family 4 protein [Terriglobales bacterium]
MITHRDPRRQPQDAHVVVAVDALLAPLAGLGRYVQEMTSRLKGRVEPISPPARQKRIAGLRLAWEQLCLPTKLRGRTLWSPTNTGPLVVRNQVVTIHDLVCLDHPEWLNSRVAALLRFLLPRLARRVRHIMTDSQFSKIRIMKKIGVPASKISVVYPGVSSRFTPQPLAEIERVRHALRLPNGPYVLSVGTREPRKNLGRLLAAWRCLADGPAKTYSIVVVGRPGEERVFGTSEEIPAHPRVHFTGFVDDEMLPALYSGATTFVYPSLYEGFGLPPLEAMACGVPVAASHATAMPEVVGNAGLLFNPEDTTAIAQSLKAMLENQALRDQYRAIGRARATAFSWDKAAEQAWAVLAPDTGGLAR